MEPSREAITDLFPLTVGTRYTYTGTVSWQTDERIELREVTWSMEVLDETPPYFSGEVVGFRMRGHPMDLAWYTEDKEPSEYAIIRVGLNRYYKTDLKALERLQNPGDGWHSLVSENEVFLDLPLYAGKRFGSTDQICRNDNRYYWFVEAAEPVTQAIAGVNPNKPIRTYAIRMITGPDQVEIRFAPGIGIVRCKYGHHGTVSAADVRLVEFRRGSTSPSSAQPPRPAGSSSDCDASEGR